MYRYRRAAPVPGYLSHGVESEAGPRGRRCPQGCRSREAAPSAMPHPGATGPGAVTEPVGFFEDEDWSSSYDSSGWVAATFFRPPIASAPPGLRRRLAARIDRVLGVGGGVCWPDWRSGNRETDSESGSTSIIWDDFDEMQSDPSEQSWDLGAPPPGSSPCSASDRMKAPPGDDFSMPTVRCCLHRWRV